MRVLRNILFLKNETPWHRLFFHSATPRRIPFPSARRRFHIFPFGALFFAFLDKEKEKKGKPKGKPTVKPATKPAKSASLFGPPPPAFDDVDRQSKDVLELHPPIIGAKLTVQRSWEPSKLLTSFDSQIGPHIRQGGHMSSVTANTSINGWNLTATQPLSSWRTFGSIEWKPKAKPYIVRAQFRPESSRFSFNADGTLKGPDYTATLSTSDSVSTLAYMQSIHPKIVVGAQFIYAPDSPCPSILAWAFRLKNPGIHKEVYVAQALSDTNAVFLSYHKTIIPKKLQLSTTFQYVGRSHESNFAVGGRWTADTYDYVAKLTSQKEVSVHLDMAITDSFRLTLSGELLHGTPQSSFGIGFSARV